MGIEVFPPQSLGTDWSEYIAQASNYTGNGLSIPINSTSTYVDLTFNGFLSEVIIALQGGSGSLERVPTLEIDGVNIELAGVRASTQWETSVIAGVSGRPGLEGTTSYYGVVDVRSPIYVNSNAKIKIRNANTTTAASAVNLTIRTIYHVKQ